jgi:hypothetical protein
MTTTTRTSVPWRCPVCRASGTIEHRAGIDPADAIVAAHATKQPRCDGVPTATESNA